MSNSKYKHSTKRLNCFVVRQIYSVKLLQYNFLYLLFDILALKMFSSEAISVLQNSSSITY